MNGGFGSTDGNIDGNIDGSTDGSTDGGIGFVVSKNVTARPIGVSPALEKAKDPSGLVLEDWFRGYKWPPADVVPFWTNAAPTQFPRRYWDSFHHSVAVLGDFVRTTDSSGRYSYEFSSELNAILAGAIVADELKELVELAEYRSGVMSEAMAQRANLDAYWRGIFMFNRASHPWTCQLLDIALCVGQFQAMQYKREFNRPRPSQLSPALLPPIDPPGHASFPSGHATEAYLMALCLEAAMLPATAPGYYAAAATPATIPPAPPQHVHARVRSPLLRMAERIARNREVLGLHYPSDSEAGRVLAQRSFDILMRCTRKAPGTSGASAGAQLGDSIQSDPAGQGIIDLARQEWH
jgi:PAP2 superfamily